MLILITALAAIAEIVPVFARKPLFNRDATIGSLVAIAVIGTLAWMQNMLTAPLGIGWMYFAMVMSLALIVPFGLIVFNLIATLVGGTLRMRAPLLFAAGALSAISIGLAAEIEHSMVAVAWRLHNTVDATASTHFALVGGAVFGGFAALHYWFPKLTGRTMGETLARFSFWTMALGLPATFVPLFIAGGDHGQVVDAYKFFSGTGVGTENLISTIGAFVLGARHPADDRQRDHSAAPAAPAPGTTTGAATRSSGSRSRRRSRTTSTCCPTCAATARCATSGPRSATAAAAPKRRARPSR